MGDVLLPTRSPHFHVHPQSPCTYSQKNISCGRYVAVSTTVVQPLAQYDSFILGYASYVMHLFVRMYIEGNNTPSRPAKPRQLPCTQRIPAPTVIVHPQLPCTHRTRASTGHRATRGHVHSQTAQQPCSQLESNPLSVDPCTHSSRAHAFLCKLTPCIPHSTRLQHRCTSDTMGRL